MKITRLQLQNVRCFEIEDFNLSDRINVIVGPNNNGKTTILHAVSTLQLPRNFGQQFVRLNSSFGIVRIWVDKSDHPGLERQCNNFYTQTNMADIQGRLGDQTILSMAGFPNLEPNNFVIPYQSKRKVGGYSEGITLGEVSQVTGTLSNLYAKVDRIANPEFQPAYSEYIKACDEILGFRVSTTNSGNGKKAAFIVRNEQSIPIDMMGEGISNLLGLIVDLCRVENKLFIIEEPENDIHPQALKKLLDLIIAKSSMNQFLITTHSNIVLKHLGASPGTKVFNVEMSLMDRIPSSSIHAVDSQEKRRAVLEDLGYEPFDYEIWDYWIFFEESSAERICREFLIPWFVPKLKGKVRTFSARTVSEVALKFDDFNRLFIFLHLQEIYRNRVWVIIDGGENERSILEEIATKYKATGWSGRQFRQLTKHNFEEYFPQRFQADVAVAIGETDKRKRAERKRALLDRVIEFCAEQEETAKSEFQISANEIISLLKEVRKS